jgi:hypothetical protein
VPPRQISVAGAKQMLDAFRVTLSTGDGAMWGQRAAAMLHAIGGRRVGRRPDRCEPREVKRRPKGDSWLTKPRAERRAELMASKNDGQ